MRLGYFAMPIHPMHREPSVTLQEDRQDVIFADRLGFHDALAADDSINQ